MDRTPITQFEVTRIAYNGLSMPTAAAEIGVTRQAIFGALHRFDLHDVWKNTRRKLKDAQNVQIPKLCQNCETEIQGKRYRYCSNRCKNKINNDKKLVKRIATNG